MKITNIKFNDFIVDKHLRIDSKFHNFYSKKKWNVFGVPESKRIKLKEVIYEEYKKFEMEEGNTYKGIPTGQKYINKYGLIDNYNLVCIDDCPNRIKYKISKDNILISSLRLAKAPATYFENINLGEYIFSNGFYIFRVKNNWNKKYITKILQLDKIKSMLDNNIYRGIGISSYKVDDLLEIEIRNIPIKEQLEILEKIAPFEEEVLKLILEKEDTQEIIDTVFQNYFDYDYCTFEQLKAINNQNNKFETFANNRDLRFSSKFHKDSGKFVMNELTKTDYKKLKDFISEPIVLGASISPSDFDENGSAYFLSMATIKSLEVELDDTQLVSDNYYAEKKQDKSIKINDIIIARSGVAIGKTAIVLNEFDGIFADFTMRIRMNAQHCIPMFAYYYFRSKYFQYLIEVNKKGVQNQNIFPSMIREFPIPNISLTEQAIIVKQIQEKIDKQNEIDNRIEKIQKTVMEIVEKSINL